MSCGGLPRDYIFASLEMREEDFMERYKKITSSEELKDTADGGIALETKECTLNEIDIEAAKIWLKDKEDETLAEAIIKPLLYKTLEKICPVIEETKCEHKWKTYMGLSEQFLYCELCDEKRSL